MFENKSNYGIIQIEKRRLIMKILHLADLHLGKILQEQSFLEDQKYMLNKIIEKIKEENKKCCEKTNKKSACKIRRFQRKNR